MPLYEYQCTKCEKVFEELVSSHRAAGDVTCPACGHRNCERLPSTFAAHDGGRSAPPPGPCGQCQPGGGCPYSMG